VQLDVQCAGHLLGAHVPSDHAALGPVRARVPLRDGGDELARARRRLVVDVVLLRVGFEEFKKGVR
jgi:hypothetical protein